MNYLARILVVDDDDQMRGLLQALLADEGYEIITASNGKDALKAMEEDKPNLVFLDIEMPEMDGLGVLDEMQQRSLHIPVIVITGHSTMDNAIQAIRSGAKEFITKPFDLNKIRAFAKRYLNKVS